MPLVRFWYSASGLTLRAVLTDAAARVVERPRHVVAADLGVGALRGCVARLALR